MFFIVFFVLIAFASLLTVGVLGSSAVALRAFRLLAWDVRLWWTVGSIVAAMLVRAGVYAMHENRVPTEKLHLGLFQFQMIGGYAGTAIGWIVGLIALSSMAKRLNTEPASLSWIGGAVGLMIAVYWSASLYSLPSVVRKSTDESNDAFVAAMKAEDIETVRKMISSGYKPDSSYAELNGHSPTTYAIALENTELIKTFLDGSLPRAAEGLIGPAVATGNPEIVDQVVQHGGQSDKLLGLGLKDAIIDGNREYFDYFLQLGADPNYQYTHTVLMQAAGKNRIEFVRELIQRGAKVDTLSKAPSEYTGSTALIWAVREGHIEMVKLLLEAGADVNLHDPKHASALIRAARNDDKPMVRLLLENGADVNATQRGKTVIELLESAKTPNVEMLDLLRNATSES